MSSPRPREGTLPLRVAVTTTAAAVWVHILGEVDLSNRDDLRTALSAVDYQSAQGVHIDLRRLTFCDSAGCLVMLEFERSARAAGPPTEIWVSNATMKKLIAFLTRECWPAELAPTLRFEAADHG
jgi:anti-anti-sigma factor